jgi:WD40 repeat protein
MVIPSRFNGNYKHLWILLILLIAGCNNGFQNNAHNSLGASSTTVATESFILPPELEVKTRDNVLEIEELLRVGEGTLVDVAVSPDGHVLALSGSMGIWLYETETLTLIKELNGHAGNVESVDWSPDVKYLASGSLDRTIRIWDIDTGETLHELNNLSNVS